jgi:uncharacterized SAM-binding protein YcdF (DUF218 family)
MFFYASKLIWFLAAPSTILTLAAALGAALLFTRFFRTGRVLVALAAAGFVLFGSSPLPRFMIRTLENRFPQPALDSGEPVDGIIVLGGALDYRRGQMRLTDSGVRMTTALALARRYPEARVVFTGGSDAVLLRAPVSEAEMAQSLFRDASLTGSRVVYEGHSRNTRENALFTARLVKPQPGERWLLVTSAFHMPRAVGTFRAAGWPVVAYPVDFRSDDSLDDLRPFRMVSEGLRVTDITVREWLGLVAYRLNGYTDALLPAPSQADDATPVNPSAAAPDDKRP